jgi:magnesium transporter
MQWHDLRDPNDPLLDRLAAEHQLHPLHIEDCRHGGQKAKAEQDGSYLFVVLKPVQIDADGYLTFSDLDLFLGRDFLITVQESECEPLRKMLDTLRASSSNLRPDQLFYKVIDAVVDSYLPVLDHFDELTDTFDEAVLQQPSPETLEKIFRAKRSLIELRRVLANTRDVAGYLQRSDSELISRDLWPFLRDVYDHVARNLDTVEVQRDLLGGAMEIYLSSQAQRTNQVMKVLTVLGTIALPALVISGFYGMNLQDLPGAESPHGAWIAAGLMAASTVVLLAFLRYFRWL